MTNDKLAKEIQKLKKEKNAVILAHNYQLPEVQDVADFVGDSLQLAQEAAKTDADMIVFCGVHFMAETAKILNPKKLVVMPDKTAGCPMANMINAEKLKAAKAENPNAKVVAYVNTTAETKALSDICCTSSNAQKVVDSLDTDEILFVPDQYLGEYVARTSDKKFSLYPGYCPTHHRIQEEHVKEMRKKHPDALVLCHPECSVPVKAASDYVLSTGHMIQLVKENPAKEFIIATEQGILHQMEKQNPDKKFYHVTDLAICPNMKKTNLTKVYDALVNPEEHAVTVEAEIAQKAVASIERMLEVV